MSRQLSTLLLLLTAGQPTPAINQLEPCGYLLPFPLGDSAELLQGNGGPYGHQGAIRYAYDFARPIGSVVTAARAGIVIRTEQRFVDGNRTPGQENYIFIQHADSTFGRYYHLTQGGVGVANGARVSAGDTIGRSGNTGASAGPHLHFDVTRGCPDWGCQTIPIRFCNAGVDSLVDGPGVSGRGGYWLLGEQVHDRLLSVRRISGGRVIYWLRSRSARGDVAQPRVRIVPHGSSAHVVTVEPLSHC